MTSTEDATDRTALQTLIDANPLPTAELYMYTPETVARIRRLVAHAIETGWVGGREWAWAERFPGKARSATAADGIVAAHPGTDSRYLWTPDEAREFAAELVKAADEAEGQGR